MIYFITNRQHNIDSSVITINDFQPLYDYLDTIEEVCYDKEFNGLNELNSIPLLTIIGDRDNQFVIDDTSFPSLSHLQKYADTKLFIGHNIKIDIKVSRLQGLDIRNVYDTMIVEQRLGMGSKRLNNLKDVYERRVKRAFPTSKDIRTEFESMDKYSIFNTRHIVYGAGDVCTLQPIKEVQREFITRFKYELLIDEIENPLIPIIADMELEGISINEDKWKEVIKENKLKLIKVNQELDEILENLNLIRAKGARATEEVEQLSMFSNVPSKMIEQSNLNRINYNSDTQILAIFEKANLPKPKDIDKSKDKVTGIKNRIEKDSVGEPALNKYLIEYPNSILKPFILKLIDRSEIAKQLSSFGDKFLVSNIRKKGKNEIGYRNDKTGKVHTIYKQCATLTGRFSSGNSKIGFYNSQQIPRDKKFRTAFCLTEEEIADDWWITTCDLTGAEVVIMCAFAKDKDLYKWAVEEDDLHSPMATKCWRAVYEFRKNLGRDLTITSINQSSATGKKISVQLSPEIVINKKQNDAFRTDFKAVTFAVVYRAGAATIASTLNIPVDEAEIVINVIKSSIPATFLMIDRAIAFSKQNMYLTHNTRTNSRSWFEPLLRHTKNKSELHAVEGEASNRRIQGTQADMIKEAMVEIHKYYKKNNILNCPLLQIHDELVWKHKGKENGNIIPLIMSEVATKYLEGFTSMKAEAQTLHTWIK